ASHATTSPSRPEGKKSRPSQSPKPIRDTGDNPRPRRRRRRRDAVGDVPERAAAAAVASSSYSASAPCAGRWRRSRASARRWTASGAPSPPRASAALTPKVEQLSEEVDSLKETLDKHSLRQRKRILEAKERAELFERANGESSHVLEIFDDEAQAMQSARSSSRMLDEAFETGVAILHK
uniref:Uncharacterized protein n=1 Tax=Aegilops tauschii subsp. strangulata TaxID=200361 RepID=A0A453QIE2_AEGTS